MSQFPEFDLYAALHLAHDATMEDVRVHYLKIMRGNHVDHPDFLARIKQRFPQQTEETDADYSTRIGDVAKRSVQRFNVAYEILSDPDQRKEYDRHISGFGTVMTEDPVRDRFQAAPPPAAAPPLRRSAKSGSLFFNRSEEQKSRKTWADPNTSRDKFCIWKQ